MRSIRLIALLALTALLLSGCRFAVVETGGVRVTVPAKATEKPE